FAGGTPALHTRHAASLRTAGLKKNEKFSGKNRTPRPTNGPGNRKSNSYPANGGGINTDFQHVTHFLSFHYIAAKIQKFLKPAKKITSNPLNSPARFAREILLIL
ncbi:MAG: hypothetical protein II849_08440, partial [Bacteroidales bacterium]|nr:hypothetical protein [Bacteroidales bacterium]